jgi:hypothetical protein
VEVIARETNRYSNKFLENTPNLKLRSRTHHWKKTNRNELMKLLAFFQQKPDNKSYFSWRKILKTPIFLDLFSERRFHLLLKFHFVDDENGHVMKQGTMGKTIGLLCVPHHFQCYHMVADF